MAPEVAQPAPMPAPPLLPASEAESYEREVQTDFPSCDADTEMNSARRAKELLSGDRPQEALWLLGAFQRQCPSGRWSREAWEVRMASLCRLGHHAEVVGLLRWFGVEYPAQRAAVVADLGSSCPREVLSHDEGLGE